MSTIDRPDAKLGPDLLSQVQQIPQLSNFVRIVAMPQTIHGRVHHHCQVAFVQCYTRLKMRSRLDI